MVFVMPTIQTTVTRKAITFGKAMYQGPQGSTFAMPRIWIVKKYRIAAQAICPASLTRGRSPLISSMTPSSRMSVDPTSRPST